MAYLRALLVWFIIIAVETCHGIARALFIVPLTGDFRARQIGVFIGALLVFFTTILFIRFINTTKKSTLLSIGFGWVFLTLLFEIILGRLLGYSWNRLLADYNLLKGGLMPIGLLLMVCSPLLAAKCRNLLH
ncbi:MAG TPA: hypothetical protein PLX60_00370 [Chitinophagales bacterium]|nr:hypothetical protein [Chitinophagales bacterium]